jgi:protocatechuate 3,4-dioxygenase beta subunit
MDPFSGRKCRRMPHPHIPSNGILLLMVLLTFSLAACTSQTTENNPPSLPLPDGSVQAIPQTGSGPTCSSPATPTVALTEGPYFKAGSPERTSLIDSGVKGTKLVLSGYVLTTDCSPAAHALMDFWQADSTGQYDNSGYILRGHQFTDATGHYQLTTIVPGLYPGRTEHIHVKVQVPGGPVLTTQLFFPGVPENESDGIFDPSLVMNIQPAADGLEAEFNFIVSAH